jgi:hypothetical protein
MNKNGWPTERRKRQAEMIKNWKPWEHSTGAKTEAGKKFSTMNALKHGWYSAEFRTTFKEFKKTLRDSL